MQLVHQIMPRLKGLEMPAIVPIIGAGGVGKSALFNQILGAELAKESALRPTTRIPLAAVHPEDAPKFAQHLLSKTIHTEISPSIPRGIVLIDSPAFDIADPEAAQAARQVQASAAAAIFVTTPTRYSDAASWQFLSQLEKNETPLFVVLNRVDTGSQGVAAHDLSQRLAQLRFTALPGQSYAGAAIREDQLRQRAERRALLTLHNWLQAAAQHHAQESQAMPAQVSNNWRYKLEDSLETVANMLDSARNTIVDLADKAEYGAAAPLEKLATNIERGRFGQGAPAALWNALGKEIQADALAALADTVTASVTLALKQGIITASINIANLWREDVLDTSSMIASAQAQVNEKAAEITQRTISQWRADVENEAAGEGGDPVAKQSLAHLLLVAASGVPGALAAARNSGMEQVVWRLRELLGQRVREAIEAVVQIYAGQLNYIAPLGSEPLRNAWAAWDSAMRELNRHEAAARKPAQRPARKRRRVRLPAAGSKISAHRHAEEGR